MPRFFKVRDEQKFPSITHLKQQIMNDIIYVKQTFGGFRCSAGNIEEALLGNEHIAASV